MPTPQSSQVHVLVVVPEIGSKRPAENELVRGVMKRMKIMESNLAATIGATIAATMAAVEPKTLTDFKNLAVNEDEFRLDSLSTTRQVDSPIAMTPTLHEF
ncbi:hypothetical protein ON010_g2743 [Phytophthora cinnamomi]|nr:hypothetical protein ON010_g2743 [Phytophthora cinnamomi]